MIAERGIRRIVTADLAPGRSGILDDSPIKDVLRDAARPGFASARVWATIGTPAAPLTLQQIAQLPRSLQPPATGSVFHVVTIPLDAAWQSTISAQAVKTYFEAAGSPEASRFGPEAPHPYMQQTRSLDLCVVLEGDVTLVLDKEEVELSAGDTVVQRGTSHAWSNRSSRPVVIAISSHDAAAGSRNKV